jgi:hypothetical protein
MEEILDSDEINEVYEPARVVIKPAYFVIFSVLTFGLYEIWWIYKCWRFFREKENLDIAPAARALFSIFFLKQLCDKIADYCHEKEIDVSFNSTNVLVAYILLNLTARLPQPLWLISLLSVAPFINVVKAFNNYFTGNEEGDGQEVLSGRRIVMLIFGCLFWVLVIASFFVDDNKF